MKSYEPLKDCDDIACNHYNEEMELNCSFDDDNNGCVMTMRKVAYTEQQVRDILRTGFDMIRCNDCRTGCYDNLIDYALKNPTEEIKNET